MNDPVTRCPSRTVLLTGMLVLLLIGAVPAVLAPAKAPAPDIFTAIGNFFKSLFGIK
jgi:hypothetical protein